MLVAQMVCEGLSFDLVDVPIQIRHLAGHVTLEAAAVGQVQENAYQRVCQGREWRNEAVLRTLEKLLRVESPLSCREQHSDGRGCVGCSLAETVDSR